HAPARCHTPRADSDADGMKPLRFSAPPSTAISARGSGCQREHRQNRDQPRSAPCREFSGFLDFWIPPLAPFGSPIKMKRWAGFGQTYAIHGRINPRPLCWRPEAPAGATPDSAASLRLDNGRQLGLIANFY